MKIENIDLSVIKPYEKNPRKNDAAVNGVAESIRQFGFQQPIVIDKNGVIVAGHTRYKAAKKLGLKTVPCVRAETLTEEQTKAYRILDNKLNELSSWDLETLKTELESVDFDFAGFDVELPSFEQKRNDFDNHNAIEDEGELTLYPEYEDEDECDYERSVDLNNGLDENILNGVSHSEDGESSAQKEAIRETEQINRVIIVYNAERENLVCKILGIEKITQLVYRFENLKKQKNGETV